MPRSVVSVPVNSALRRDSRQSRPVIAPTGSSVKCPDHRPEFGSLFGLARLPIGVAPGSA
ncbi:conserved hypothetical protein [Streptomyces sviceus ATCC 29083]|uniref:Uncharacterized protein n=1 Tax=Streptomyces sviceus (strain ATCC 29083 / DSM 924 / JCM 4929 / NBRC 13980 / NCIMB 11184 / NRRL 5439 / UC 5370) TaxID=463191 RepID=B5I7L0_STRX2|nr:conserved hypothetical protein [Streptomyces sviceus ATCC 29083]